MSLPQQNEKSKKDSTTASRQHLRLQYRLSQLPVTLQLTINGWEIVVNKLEYLDVLTAPPGEDSIVTQT